MRISDWSSDVCSSDLAKRPAPRAGARLELKSRFDFNLAGTEALDVVPLGDSNHVELDSPWPHPSFVGTLSPGTLDVGDDGFSARWELPALAAHTQAQYLRGIRKDGKGGTMRDAVDRISLQLIEPVGVYTQDDRGSKSRPRFVELDFAGARKNTR